MNLLAKYNATNVEKLKTLKGEIPDFRAGDSVNVLVKIVEGENKRTQSFKGIVLARHNAGISSTFRVRKVAFGEGVERVFHLYSPNITIEVERYGRVRRAKLYYLRNRKGKSARIEELKKN